MASSHIGAYKNLNRIDPKVKRRLRRSEEWQNKRDEEVNKRRNIELMSPCRELDVDLSMNSSVLETSRITPPPKSAIVVEDNKTRKVQQSPSPKLRRNKNKKKVETKSPKHTKCKYNIFCFFLFFPPGKMASFFFSFLIRYYFFSFCN